jgi:hypothetical protein
MTDLKSEWAARQPTHFLFYNSERAGTDFRYSIFNILSRNSPLGVSATATSPTLRPISALPIGDSFEIFPLRGSASFAPTR